MSALSSAEALLVEHLRYTPLSLIDDVINTINAIVYRALTAIETGLLDTKPAALGFDGGQRSGGSSSTNNDSSAEERHRVEIEDGVHQLETLLEATVDRTFDKFEIYTLRNILHVPDGLESWVRLRHYEGLELEPSADTPTPDTINRLRQQLQATRQLNLTLSHTHASNAELLTQLKHTLSDPNGQLSHLDPSTTTLLQPGAQFTRSQLPALKSLLDDLRPRLPAMAALAEEGATPGKGGDQRDERVKYMDDIVNRVVGSQLGATREPDGELGQRRTTDEVRSLERIATDANENIRRRE